jgi:glycosyltransferase involved in cell wall biosynthesis
VAQRYPTILQIIPRLDTGGAERTTVEITAAVAASGGRALVASEGGRMAQQVIEAGGQIIPFPAGTKNPAYMLANGFRLARLIEREGVDLLHARSRAPAWSALLAARMTGCAYVTTYHGAYAERGPLKRGYNSVMARGDVVIANSRYTAELIQARYGTPAKRIRVIHRGIDEATFDPDRVVPERVSRLRRSWGVGTVERVVLLAARLTGWKGQSVLIDAFGALPAGVREGVCLVLAGDAQGRTGYVDDLQRQAAALDLADRVRLVGHVEDMPAAYLAAHVCVVASTEPEAFGRAAAEAQAMGCPVIATGIGAAPETVRAVPAYSAEEITGWLVPPNDPGALADRLRAALALSGEQRTAMGARARAHIMSAFSLESMQLATLRSYDELLGSSMAEQFCAARKLAMMRRDP